MFCMIAVDAQYHYNILNNSGACVCRWLLESHHDSNNKISSVTGTMQPQTPALKCPALWSSGPWCTMAMVATGLHIFVTIAPIDVDAVLYEIVWVQQRFILLPSEYTSWHASHRQNDCEQSIVMLLRQQTIWQLQLAL